MLIFLVPIMNSTKEEVIHGQIKGVWPIIVINTPRVWLFGDTIDGMWILLPIAAFGTVVNSFLVSFSVIYISY